MEPGMMILVQLNCHMFVRKLLKQNGAQLLHYLAVKRNVGKLERMKRNVEEYLVVAGILLLKLMASREIIASNLLVIHFSVKFILCNIDYVLYDTI